MLQRIGKFEILGQIGRGGQGTVYRARDTGLDRIVAITVTAGPAGSLALVIGLSFSKDKLRRGRSFGRNEAIMAELFPQCCRDRVRHHLEVLFGLGGGARTGDCRCHGRMAKDEL